MVREEEASARTRSIDRIGAMPVPVATNRRSRGESRRTKVPAGPLNDVQSPCCKPNRYSDPGPPETRFSTSWMASRWFGDDAMEYGLVAGREEERRGTSKETNCP